MIDLNHKFVAIYMDREDIELEDKNAGSFYESFVRSW